MKNTEIIPVDQTITTALEKGNVTAKVLADLKQYNGLKIAGLDDKAGYKAVHEARMVCKNTRVLAQKLCKAGREEAIAVQKAWIGKEKEIVAQIEETENYLQEQQDAIDNEKKRIEDEKRETERLRIQARIDKLAAVGYAIDFEIVSTITDEQFEATLKEATELHTAELERLAQVEHERLAEVARIEAIQVEQEKERKRLEAIEREQQEREAKIKADQQAEANKLRLEREAIEREKAEIERAKELEAAKKAAAEQALKDAEEKRIREENERIERERKVAEETARIEALKPIKDKYLAWVESLTIEISGELTDHPTVKSVFQKHAAFKQWAREQVNTIQ